MKMPGFFLLLGVMALSARGERLYYVNDFLNNGGGARPMALGEAMAADFQDRSSGFYNPCGILGFERLTLLASHAVLFKGLLDYTFASGVYPLRKDRAVGAYFVRSAVDEIWDTRGFETDDDGRPIYSSARLRFVDNADYAAGFSYAALWRERLRYGLTLKFIRRRFADLTSFGTALDAGVQYLHPFGWTFGLMGRNLTTSLNRYYEDVWEIGLPEVFPGVGFRKDVEYLYGGITLLYQFPNLLPTSGVSQGAFGGAFDFEGQAPSGNSLTENPVRFILNGNLGAEYHYHNKLFVRLGTNPVDLVTAGAGIRIGRLVADMALRHHPDLDDGYRLAVSWDF